MTDLARRSLASVGAGLRAASNGQLAVRSESVSSVLPAAPPDEAQALFDDFQCTQKKSGINKNKYCLGQIILNQKVK